MPMWHNTLFGDPEVEGGKRESRGWREGKLGSRPLRGSEVMFRKYHSGYQRRMGFQEHRIRKP